VDAAQLREPIPVGGFTQVLQGRVPDSNTESYAHIAENDFKPVRASPLSTF